MIMLHIRYDWRRPAFWSALCLSLFFSSQTKSIKGEPVPDSEMSQAGNQTKPVAGKQEHYDRFSTYLFVVQ